jgi:hypothetical protein
VKYGNCEEETGEEGSQEGSQEEEVDRSAGKLQQLPSKRTRRGGVLAAPHRVEIRAFTPRSVR